MRQPIVVDLVPHHDAVEVLHESVLYVESVPALFVAIVLEGQILDIEELIRLGIHVDRAHVLAGIGTLGPEIDLFKALLVDLRLARAPEHLLSLLPLSLNHELMVQGVIWIVAGLARECSELVLFLWRLFLIKKDLGRPFPRKDFFFALSCITG